MIITKLFEIRDSATFIPVLAAALISDVGEEAYLLGRAGYHVYGGTGAVMITRLENCLAANDPHEWGNRTMQTAHQYIEDHFNELCTGAVIDVQFILGETKKSKDSERWAVPYYD